MKNLTEVQLEIFDTDLANKVADAEDVLFHAREAYNEDVKEKLLAKLKEAGVEDVVIDYCFEFGSCQGSITVTLSNAVVPEEYKDRIRKVLDDLTDTIDITIDIFDPEPR